MPACVRPPHRAPGYAPGRQRLTASELSKQANFYIMWAASFMWLGLTGITGAKLGLVGDFLALTVPAFVYDLMRATGSDDDRLQLPNLMSQTLGPAVLGDNPEENMPYRHARRLLEPTARAPDENDDDDDDNDNDDDDARRLT